MVKKKRLFAQYFKASKHILLICKKQIKCILRHLKLWLIRQRFYIILDILYIKTLLNKLMK